MTKPETLLAAALILDGRHGRFLKPWAGGTGLGGALKRGSSREAGKACRHNLKTLDQAARRRNVEHRPGHKGVRQRHAVVLHP